LSQQPIISPSPFVAEWSARLVDAVPPPRRALDIAMGRGRHALQLARAGYETFGVDVRLDAVFDAAAAARAAGLSLRAWCADLTAFPLPRERFELVVVTRYLQRDLFQSIRDAIVHGGAVLYETFTVAQRAHGTGPRSPDHLLLRGELRDRFDGFDVLLYEEVDHPEALARIVARRSA
jgi:SAM-dependent methyltransferase